MRENPNLFDRVRSVSYKGTGLGPLEDFLPTVVDLCVFFRFTDGFETELPYDEDLWGPLTVGPGLPFRSLVLSTVHIMEMDWSRLRNIKKLHLCDIASPSLSFSSDLMGTLSIATGIRELVLEDLDFDSVVVVRDPIKILLPFLHVLTLKRNSTPFATYLLDSINAPNCYTIELSWSVSESVGWGWIVKTMGPTLVKSSSIVASLDLHFLHGWFGLSFFTGKTCNVRLNFHSAPKVDSLLNWPTRLQEVGCLAPIHLTVNCGEDPPDINVFLPLSTLEAFSNVSQIHTPRLLVGTSRFVTRLSAVNVGRATWPCPSLKSLIVSIPPEEVEALLPTLNPRWIVLENQNLPGWTLLTLSSRDPPNVQGTLLQSSTSNDL